MWEDHQLLNAHLVDVYSNAECPYSGKERQQRTCGKYSEVQRGCMLSSVIQIMMLPRLVPVSYRTPRHTMPASIHKGRILIFRILLSLHLGKYGMI